MSGTPRGYIMTHTGSTRGRSGRSRVRLRDTGRWWTSASGIKFRKTDGKCNSHDMELLIQTVRAIPHPDGIDVEILPTVPMQRDAHRATNQRKRQ